MTRVSLSILILFLLVLGTFSLPGGHQTPGATYPAKTRQAGVSRAPTLGIDCGLGAREAVLNGTGYPVAPSENGAFETLSSCTWIGDVALTGGGTADGTNEPLVSDQDESFGTVSPQIGGGFTADIVYLQNATSTLNGFDIFVSWNPSILHAVMIDQGGTNWGALSPFNAVQTVDNTVGQAHLVQLVFASYGQNFTLFRIRFDVVGIGSTGLTLNNSVITNPGAVVHQTIQSNFNSETFFDPTHTLNWSGSFTFSPNPPVPGLQTTFTATITCPGCTGLLHYQWDFNSDGATDSTTSPATITIPTPTFFVSRITLKIADSASPSTHNATVAERLPFTAVIQGPSSLPGNTAATWNGLWLGGIGNYTVSWRFCPGGIINTVVCSKPASSVASQASQNNTQTLSGSIPGYHFSGVYNVSLRVTDSGSGSLPANTMTAYNPLNVTGGTPVFTVQVTSQSAPVGSPTKISAAITYSSAYPTTTGFRSTLFKYTLYWGDGASSILTSAGLTVSASHVYLSAASYPVTVIAQDLQTLSQIQETGFATVNIPSSTGFDYSLSLIPSQGSVASGGGTSSSRVIVNTLTGAPQTVSLEAISPSPGIAVSFNTTSGLPPYTAAMTVTVSLSTPIGTYSIVVVGNTTSLITHQALFRLTVGSPSIPVVGVFGPTYGSANITDPSLTIGSRFSVQVNVTNALPFNAYEFALYFDQNYISLYSYDISTGTVFDNPYKVPNTYNNTGALRLAVVNLATTTNNRGLFGGGSGRLANLVFSVVKVGVSPLALAAGMSNPSSSAAAPGGLCPQCPTGASNWTRLIDGVNHLVYGVETSDGYFKNVSGKSGPVASFTVYPTNPSPGDTVTFNATSSFDPDSLSPYNHGIMEYLWDFGDVSGQANLTSVIPMVTHTFQSYPNFFSGNFSIRLTVIDLDNGFQGMKTLRLEITHSVTAVHDVGVSLNLSSNMAFQGGTVVLSVQAANLGTTTETFDLTLIRRLASGLQNVTFVRLTAQTVSSGSFVAYTFFLNTTSLAPDTYNIVATVSDPLDTNPLNNVAVAQLQVLAPDELPTASFTFTPQTPVIGQDVIFNGTRSLDPDGAIVSWTWIFGDGYSLLNLRSPLADHIYNSPGNYTVTLTVTDISGLMGSETLIVRVLPRPQHDVALNFVHPYPSVAVSGQKISLEADIVNTGSNSSTVDLTFYYGGKVAVTQRGLLVSLSPYIFYVYVQWDTTGIPAGNYTLSATVFLSGDPTPADNSLTDGQLIILPPPILTLIPNAGPVGTLVVAHGSGFPIPSGQLYPVELEMTFDDQLVGFFFIQSSSFNFSFDVPDAQVGVHQVHALQLFPSNLDVQAVFTVTPTPAPISVSVTVGTIYFPGDTATIFVMTSLNGQASSVGSLQVILIRPNGTSLTLTALPTAAGLYKASYTIPPTGSIGTYAVTARAHLTGSGDGSALASFEVKPSWLSSNSKNIATGIAITGLVGVAALAWRRGYLKKNDGEE